MLALSMLAVEAEASYQDWTASLFPVSMELTTLASTLTAQHLRAAER